MLLANVLKKESLLLRYVCVTRRLGVARRPASRSPAYAVPTTSPLRPLSQAMGTESHGDSEPWSETRKIRLDLEAHNHDIWRFAIYRTTYDDDGAGEQFQNIIKDRAREQLLASTGPYLLESLDWKFFDDQGAFDNASVATLCEHFSSWVEENWQLEQPCGKNARSPRYRFFLRVDQEALDSVLDRNNVRSSAPWADAGWVHVIDAQ